MNLERGNKEMIRIAISTATTDGVCISVERLGDSLTNEGAEEYLVCLLDIMGMSQVTTLPPEGMNEREHLEKLHRTIKRTFNEIRDFLMEKGKFHGGPIRVGHYKGYAIVDDEEFKLKNGLDLDY